MKISVATRGARRALTLRFPAIAVALLVMVLVLPTAVRGAGGSQSTGGVPSSQATPDVVPDELPEEVENVLPEPSSIAVYAYDCPAPFGGDLELLAANCVRQTTAGSTFDIFGPNFMQTYYGMVEQGGVEAGVYTIRSFVSPGSTYPIVFCSESQLSGNQTAPQEVVVYDGYLEWNLAAGTSLSCDWFQIPAGAYDTGTILVNKHFCPPIADFDAYGADVYGLAENCQEPASPVTFTASRNGTELATQTTPGAPNYAAFEGLQTGTIEIREDLPEGYGDPIVHCSVSDELGNDRAPLTQAQVDNDRILWELTVGDVVFCDWFNVPAERGTTISVVKITCPDSLGHDVDGSDGFQEACTETTEGVSFKLDGASTGNPGEQTTDANGQVTWSEMEADHYYLTEDVPSGYGRPVVFCGYYLPEALELERTYERYEVSGENRIEFDVADGQSIVCLWYNVSEDWGSATPTATKKATGTPKATGTAKPDATAASTPGSTSGTTSGKGSGAKPGDSQARPRPTATGPASLTIRAFRCEAGYDYRADDADPEADCTERPDDVVVELEAVDAPSGQTPRRADTGDSQGEATFADVTAGDYDLTRIGLESEDTAFVLSCESDVRDFEGHPFWPFATVAADGSVRLSLVPGESLTCDWFEVIAEETGQS